MRNLPNDIYQTLHPEDYGFIFKAIMKHSKDGLFVTDPDGNVVMANQATLEMCDVEASQILGRNVKDLVKKGFWDPSVSLEVIEKKRTVSLIHTTHRKKKLLSTGIPIFDKENRLRFVLVNDRDISFLNHMIDVLEAEETPSDRFRFELSDYGLVATEMEGLAVYSQAMAAVIQKAVRAAKFDMPLVLIGESGVGKSLIAKLIHRLSDRRHGLFLDLNCGAIAANLLESELFGHERGAFTGASAKGKKGLFETAHRGTLFLDEISEIPRPLQSKLLKFLESGQFFRVGGVDPVTINTRIITASNRDLDAMVREGDMRSDLYFRLNVVPIKIPPLRDHSEAIEPLIQFFLARFNKEYGIRKIISKTTRETLSQYRFPGNVRELENLVKRLVTMTEGDFIRVKHLPKMLLRSLPCGDQCARDELKTLHEEVVAFERRILLDAVDKHGSQRKAAKELGLSQSTLSRKLRKTHPKKIVHN